MPKKNSKKSVEGDQKTQTKNTSATSLDKSASDNEKEKNLYLIQVRYLNEQLERYRLKCDQLEQKKKDLECKYSALEKEKKDITDYLRRSLLEKENEVDELTELLENERKTAESDRDSLQLQHSQLRQELQDQIEGLTSENRKIVSQLAALEEFQKQKDELMSNMMTLEKQLSSQEEEHKAAIHSLEMNALLEQRRMEMEMKSQVEAMEAKVQHLAEQKVPEKTRLALQENVEVKAQFMQLSQRANALMGQNCALRDRKSQLSLDVDILEQMLSETSRQSCIRKKVVEQLTDKCQQLQTELKDCRQELKQLQTEHTGALAEREDLRQDRVSLSEQCKKAQTKASRLETELQEERKRRSRLKRILQEAADSLREALMDSEVDSDHQWKQLMEKLLVLMGRSSLTSSAVENKQPDELQPSDAAAAARAETLSFQFEMARYRRGDLGLVPRLTAKHKHTLYRAAVGSSSTHGPLHRKLSSLRTASSVTPTDSAARFLISKTFTTKPK